MLKNDTWISAAARKGMITPFVPELVRRVEDQHVISYGLSSYGYDIRLSPSDFRIFRHIPGTVVDLTDLLMFPKLRVLRLFRQPPEDFLFVYCHAAIMPYRPPRRYRRRRKRARGRVRRPTNAPRS